MNHSMHAHASIRIKGRKPSGILLALTLLLATLLSLLPGAHIAQAQSPAQEAPLAEGQITIVGMELKPGPAMQVVPRNTGTIVSPLLVRADGVTGELPSLPADAVFLAELRGPAFGTPVTIAAQANQNFVIPPLPLDGLYTLSDIRLVSGGQVLLAGDPATVQIEVIEKVLVSQVTSRPLTAQEIADRGIIIDQDNFQVVDFTIGLGLQDERVKITFPVVLPKKSDGIVPGVPALLPTGNFGGQQPVVSNLPDLRVVFNTPNVELTGFSLELPEPPEGKPRGLVSPLPGVVIIPGNIAYLNQFFSVMLKVSNVAPGYSNLRVRDLQATVVLPPGADGVLGTSDDPLRMANLGEPPAPQPKTQQVKQPGPDGKLNTADDILTIQPQANGDAEFLVEGRREGTHQITLVMTGTLEGLPEGPVQIKGSAAGIVEVRNPQFSLTFHHPSVVTAGEEYDFDVTVTNISESPANYVSMNLLPRSLTGATLLSDSNQHIETIAPGDSETVHYRLRATKTGAVVATSYNSDGMPGRFDLKMAVGELGIPMSPNTLVLPATADALPDSLKQNVIGLLGQAYALATSPFPPRGLMPISREIVEERAVDVAAAGQRVQLHEQLPDTARDLLLDFMGNNYSRLGETLTGTRLTMMQRDYRGFDELFRKSRRGAEFTSLLGALMAPGVAAQGVLPWQAAFASAAASRPGFFQAVTGNDGGTAPVLLNVTDSWGNKLGQQALGGDILRAIPYGNFTTFASSALQASQMALIAVPDSSQHVVELLGTGEGIFDLGLIVPEGNRLRHVTFENVTIHAGGRGRVAFVMGSGSNTYRLELDANGDGVYESSVLPVSSDLVVDPGPTAISSVQIFIPNPRSHPSKYGTLVSVLFSEEISLASSQQEFEGTITNFAVDANAIRATRLQPRGRVVYMWLRDGVGPFVDRTMTVANIKDRLGTPMAQSSQSLPITMVLNGPAGTMQGTVRKADGTPVPNARIYYEGMELDFNDDPYWVLVTAKEADENGNYTFDYILKSGARFTYIDPVTNERGMLGALPRYNGDAMHVDMIFRGRGNYTGKVLQANGQPAGGAVVTVKSLFGEAGEQGYQVLADANGNFRVGGIPVGVISVSAYHGQSRGQYQLSSEIPSPNATIVQTITLQSLDQPQFFGGVQGQVFRADGITPAANIPVYTSSGGLINTDANGFYRVANLPVGSVRIRAIDEAQMEQADVATTIVPSATVTANLILFGGTGSVRGIVVDADNVPVQGAKIYGGFDVATTDANGEFLLSSLPLRNIQLTAVDEAAQLYTSVNAQLNRPGEEVMVQMVFPVQGVITGRVFRANGTTPAANLKMFALGPKNAKTYTDSQGNYRFEGMPQGDYTITAFLPDFSDGNVTFTKIVFKNETRVANIVFRGKGTVTGIVYDDDGVTPLGSRVGLSEFMPKMGKLRPLENPLCLSQIGEGENAIKLPPCEDVAVDWEIKGRNRRIDNDPSSGTFTFNNVFVGKVLVEAANVFSPQVVSAEAEIARYNQTVPVTLTLLSTSIVTGTVFNADGVTPAGAGIVVRLDAGYLRDVRVATDENGQFKFPLTSATGYTLQAMDDVNGLVGFAGGNVQAGQNAVTNIRLLRTGSVTVQVNGANGPVGGAIVRLGEGARSSRTFTGVTNAAGQITFAGGQAINEGSFSVNASSNGVLGSASGILRDIAADPTGHVTVTVTLRNDVGSVTGYFYRGDGVTPIANAQINLAGGNGGLFATTDNNGAFRFDGVPLGTVSLTAQDPVTGRRGTANGLLSSNGQTLALNMRQLAQGTVIGTVRRSSDNAAVPYAQVSLQLGSPFGGTLFAQANLAGEYQFPAVPASTYFVRATDPNTGNSGQSAGNLSVEGEIAGVDVTISVPKRGTVVGVVTSYNGLPATGAQVQISGGGSTTVDASGRYTITNVPIGEVFVTATAQVGGDGGSGKSRISFEGDVAQVNIQFPGTTTIQGHVIRADGSPAPATTLTINRLSGFPSYNRAASSTAQGAFTFAGAPVAPLQIVAKQNTLQLGATYIFTPTNVGGTSVVTITLEPAGSILARILRENGQPAAQIAIEAIGTNLVKRYGSTDGDGKFRFDDLALGAYTIKISDPLGTGIATQNVVISTQGQEVDLGDVTMDEAPPAVTVITPTNGAIAIPVNQVIRVRFSEPVNPTTVNSNNLVVNRGATLVPGTWTLSENNTLASFTPAANYPDFATVSLRVKSAVKDRAGRGLSADVISSFTTTDSTPPSVTSRAPLAGATGVELNSVVRIAFSEAIDPVWFNANSLRLLRNGTPVAGSPSLILNNTAALFVPAAQLLPNSTYTVELPAQRDVFGNAMLFSTSYTFRTLDIVPPVVNTLSAPNGTTVRVGTSALIVADVTDEDGVARVEFFVDGQSRFVDTSAPYEYSLPVVAGGATIAVTARATDNAGNQSEVASLTLTRLADVAPIVTVSTTAQNGVVASGARISVTVVARDEVGVTNIYYQAKGAASASSMVTPPAGSLVYTSTWTLQIPASAAPNAVVTIEASAKDTQNQMSALAVATLTVADGTAPTAAFLSPAAGSRVDAGTVVPVVVRGTDNGAIAAFQLQVTGAISRTTMTYIQPPRQPVTATLALTVPAGLPSNALMTLQLRSYDAQGTPSQPTSMILRVKDTQVPVTTLALQGGASEVIRGSVLTFNVSASDDQGVANLKLSSTGAFASEQNKAISPATTPASRSFTVTVPAEAPANSNVTFVATGRDEAGNEGMSTPVVLLVVADGAPTAQISAPAQIETGKVLTVVVDYADDVALTRVGLASTGVASTQVYTLPAQTQNHQHVWTINVPTTASGVIALRATATDSRGQTLNSAPVNVQIVDLTAPVATYQNVVHNQQVNPGATQTISVRGTDNASVRRLNLVVSGAVTLTDARVFTPTVTPANHNFLITVPADAASTAPITLTLTAVDAAGNSSVPNIIVLRVRDVVKPQVTLTLRTAMTQVVQGGAFTATVAASDDVGLNSIFAYIRGGHTATSSRSLSGQKAYTETFTLSIPGNIAVGTVITVSAEARDAATNIGTTPGMRLVVVPPALSVTGYVYDMGDQPVANASIIVNATNGTFNGVTDEEGHYLVSGIAVGNVKVTAIAPDGVRGSSTGTLFQGQQEVEVWVTIPNAPMMEITEPISGTTVTESQQIAISAWASADGGVGVKHVVFQVNGTTIFTDTQQPYGTNYTVPSGVTQLTIGARVTDNEGNVTPAENVVLPVIVDAFTTLQGRVVDEQGNPVQGATVTTINNQSMVTGVDGLFSFANLPTSQGNIQVMARILRNGIPLQRIVVIAPVAGGVTDVGDMVVAVSKTWDGGGDGINWSSAANWTGNTLPVASDDVYIPMTATVRLDSGTHTVNTLFSDGDLRTLAGQLTLRGDSIVKRLTVAGGTIESNYALTVTQAMTWTGGTLQGAGKTISLGTLRLSNGTEGYLNTMTFENRGEALFQLSQNFNMYNGARFVNAAGATFIVEISGASERYLNWYGAWGTLPRIVNNGSMALAPASTAPLNMGVAIENHGVLEQRSGLVNYNRLLTTDGELRINAGAIYNIGDAQTLFGTLAITGTLRTGNGGNAVWQPAQVRLAPSAIVQTSAGMLQFNMKQTLPNLVISGGEIASNTTLTVTNAMTWAGGSMTGTGRTVSLGTLNVGGISNGQMANRVLENRGTATFRMAGDVYLYNGARYINAVGATTNIVLQTAGTRSLTWYGGWGDVPVYENLGTTTVNMPTLGFGWRLLNSGIFETQQGLMEMHRNGANTGTLRILAGATMQFNTDYQLGGAIENAGTIAQTNGTVVFQPTNLIESPTALVRLQGGTLTVANSLSLRRLAQSAGTLAGAGTLTVTQNITLTGGTQSGTGRTVALGTLSVSGTNTTVFETRTFENRGTANIVLTTNDFAFHTGAQLINAAGATITVDVAAGRSQSISWYGSWAPKPNFTNNGLFIKKGAGALEIGPTLTQNGVVDLQTGTLTISGGGAINSSVTANTNTLLQLGGGLTVGVGGSVTGEGNVRFTGAATFAGGYTVSGSTVVAANGQTVNFATSTTPNMGGTLRLESGALDLDSTLGATVAQLVVAGGELKGTGTVTVTNHMTFTNGWMSDAGRTVVLGTSSMGGNANLLWLRYDRVLDLRGNATWRTNADFNAHDNARIIVGQGTTFTIETAGSDRLLPHYGPWGTRPVLENRGTIIKKGPNQVKIGITVLNHGAILDQVGNLGLTGGGVMTGTVTVEAGAQVELDGAHTLLPVSSVSGAGNVRISGVTQAQGVYNVGGTTTVAGTLTFPNATTPTVGNLVRLETNGTLTVDSAAGLSLAQLSMTGSSVLSGTAPVTVTSVLTWTGGAMQGSGRTIVANRAVLSGANIWWLRYNRTLELRGTTSLTMGTNFNAHDGARILIAQGATLDIEAPGTTARSLAYYGPWGTRPLIENRGTIIKRGTAALAIELIQQGYGAIDTQAGTLNINAPTVISGTVTTAAGAATQFTPGTNNSVTFVAGSSVSGAGDVRLAGTATVNGAWNVGGITTVAGGVTFGAATTPVFGTQVRIDTTNGVLTLNNAAGVSTPQLWISGGTLAGSANITATQAFTWTGGVMTGSGATVSANRLSMSGSSQWQLLAGRTLEVRNQGLWTMGTNAAMAQGAQLIVATGATLEVNTTNNRVITWNTAQTPRPTILVNGALVKRGAFEFSTQTALNNAGTLWINEGSIQADGTGTNTGIVRVAASATMNYDSDYTVQGTMIVTGTVHQTNNNVTWQPTTALFQPGSLLRVQGTSSHFITSAPLTVSKYWQQSGSLDNTGTLTVTSQFTWTHGTLFGTGRVVALGSTLINDGGANKRLDAQTLEIRGNALWTHRYIDGYNGAVLRVAAGATLDLRGTNSNTRFQWTSPTFGARPTLEVIGTLLRSTTNEDVRIDAAVTNRGTISIQTGGINVQAPFTQTATGNTIIAIDGPTAPTQLHRLQVQTGPVTLAGTLTIQRNAAYLPAVATTLDPVTWQSRFGQYDAITGHDAGNGNSFTTSYAANSVRLTVAAGGGQGGGQGGGLGEGSQGGGTQDPAPNAPAGVERTSLPPTNFAVGGDQIQFLPLVGGGTAQPVEPEVEQPEGNTGNAAYALRYIGAQRVEAGSEATLTARLRDGKTGQPLAGKTLTFALTPVDMITAQPLLVDATTNEAGIASKSIALAGAARTYQVTVMLRPAGEDLTAARAAGVTAAQLEESAVAAASTTVYVGGLAPASFVATVQAGASATDHVTATVSAETPDTPLDIVFSFDATQSMVAALPALKGVVEDAMLYFQANGVNVRAAIVSHTDYAGVYSSFGVTETYGAAGAQPFVLHSPLTSTLDSLLDAMDEVVLGPAGGDPASSYTRVLYESVAELLGDTNPTSGALGYRSDSQRVVVIMGDDVPHDNNLSEGMAGFPAWSTGGDPGRNGVMDEKNNPALIGAPHNDDLNLQTVLQQMATNNVVLVSYQQTPALKQYWNTWATVTGGKDVASYEELVAAVDALVVSGKPLDSLKLVAPAQYAGWVAATPAELNNVTLPITQSFGVVITPPLGTAAGIYTFTLSLVATPAQGEATTLATQAVAITVTPGAINHAPVAQNDAATVAQDSIDNLIDVRANDSDADGDALTVSALTQPANGVASTDGQVVKYTPAAGFSGIDAFTYTISDGAAVATATVQITVTPSVVNHAPIARNDAATVAQDSVDNVIDVRANDSDGDGDALTVTAVTQPANGVASTDGEVVKYTPAAGFSGGDVFTYTISDGAEVATATVQITVTPAVVNHAPVANDDTATVGTGTLDNIIDVRANDADEDGDALQITMASQPAHGATTTDGEVVRYAPTVGFTGTDVFSYTITDGFAVASAVVTVTVEGTPLTVEHAEKPAAGSQVIAGQRITYLVTLRNGSGVPYANVEVESTLAAQADFVSANAGCADVAPQPEEGKVTWQIASLAAEGECTLALMVDLKENASAGQMTQTTLVRVPALGEQEPIVVGHTIVETLGEVGTFVVARNQQQVSVTWTTTNEQGLKGFEVLRAEAGSTETQPIGGGQLPARGTPATYTLEDEGLALDHAYDYYLEVEFLDGRIVTLGPRTAGVQQYLAMIFK